MKIIYEHLRCQDSYLEQKGIDCRIYNKMFGKSMWFAVRRDEWTKNNSLIDIIKLMMENRCKKN